MPDAGFPVEMVSGVPVVVTPEEVDIMNVAGLRGVLLETAAARPPPWSSASSPSPASTI
jgi:hypothetical protein